MTAAAIPRPVGKLTPRINRPSMAMATVPLPTAPHLRRCSGQLRRREPAKSNRAASSAAAYPPPENRANGCAPCRWFSVACLPRKHPFWPWPPSSDRGFAAGSGFPPEAGDHGERVEHPPTDRFGRSHTDPPRSRRTWPAVSSSATVPAPGSRWFAHGPLVSEARSCGTDTQPVRSRAVGSAACR
jgi:hypothetical protein